MCLIADKITRKVTNKKRLKDNCVFCVRKIMFNSINKKQYYAAEDIQL